MSSGYVDRVCASVTRAAAVVMRRRLPLVLLACGLTGFGVILVHLQAREGAPWLAVGAWGDQDPGRRTIEARLDALERRQAEQFDALSRQLAALSAGNPAKLSPERERARQERREHLRRMRDDPAYELKVLQERLAGLQAGYAAEAVDHRWSSEARTLVADALHSAISRTGAKLDREQTDCRSQTCRIQLDIPVSYSYEDVATYLMTDLAELLPSAQFVVMPPRDGIRSVNIFASRASGAPTAADGG